MYLHYVENGEKKTLFISLVLARDWSQALCIVLFFLSETTISGTSNVSKSSGERRPKSS